MNTLVNGKNYRKPRKSLGLPIKISSCEVSVLRACFKPFEEAP